jgi:hypothetical protein
MDRDFFILNRNYFLRFFLSFVHRRRTLIQSTYSLVHMVAAMLAVIDDGHTISSGAGGPYTKRSH